jgi:hypothetical protein
LEIKREKNGVEVEKRIIALQLSCLKLEEMLTYESQTVYQAIRLQDILALIATRCSNEIFPCSANGLSAVSPVSILHIEAAW